MSLVEELKKSIQSHRSVGCFFFSLRCFLSQTVMMPATTMRNNESEIIAFDLSRFVLRISHAVFIPTVSASPKCRIMRFILEFAMQLASACESTAKQNRILSRKSRKSRSPIIRMECFDGQTDLMTRPGHLKNDCQVERRDYAKEQRADIFSCAKIFSARSPQTCRSRSYDIVSFSKHYLIKIKTYRPVWNEREFHFPLRLIYGYASNLSARQCLALADWITCNANELTLNQMTDTIRRKQWNCMLIQLSFRDDFETSKMFAKVW